MNACARWKKGIVVCCLSASFLTASTSRDNTKNSAEYVQEFIEQARAACKDGETSRAVTLYQRALGYDPACFDAYFELGNVRYAIDDVDEAIHNYRKALELRDHVAVHHNIGICYKSKGKYEEAISHFAEAIRQRPNYAKAYLQYASILKDKNEKQEALNLLLKAVSCGTCDCVVAREIGILYQDFGLFDLAIEQYRESVSIDPSNTLSLMQLANALCTREAYDEAIELYKRVLERSPYSYSALYNLAYALKHKGHVETAVEILLKVIEMQPENAQAHFSLGLSYLALGDFMRGWLEYEWRWDAYGEKKKIVGNAPLWEGQDIRGLRILLTAEQGLGDSFQFIRYAKVLHEAGATVVFLAQKPLKTLLQSGCDYIDQVVTPGDSLPIVDYQLPLMSLPLVLHTGLDSVPAEIPYINAQEQLVEYWKPRLSDKINIGICWNGNSNYRSQHLREVVAAKSVSLEKLARLADVSGCTFYSLQKVTGVDQLEQVKDLFIVHDFGSEVDEEHGRFMDTAAIIKNLHLVITVDTSTSHLAAALGTPTWILLPTPSDWRWMVLNEWQEKTPWYPNVRLFRQPAIGDWDSLIENVVQALEHFVASYDLKGEDVQSNETIKGDKKLLQDAHEEDIVVSEIIDKFTLHLVYESIHPTLETTDEQLLLLSQYQELIKNEPRIVPLMQGLLAANSYLVNVKHSIKDDSLLDAKSVEKLLVNVQCAHTLKNAIKEEIDQIASFTKEMK